MRRDDAMLSTYLTAPTNGRLVFIDDDESVEFECDWAGPHIDHTLLEVADTYAEQVAKRKKVSGTYYRNKALRDATKALADNEAAARLGVYRAKCDARYARFLKWVEAYDNIKLTDYVTLTYGAKWLEVERWQLMRDLLASNVHPAYWDDVTNEPVYMVNGFLYWYYMNDIEKETQ